MEFYIPTSRRWYVDPVNGNDGNDGSYSLPFATINAAIAIANHGDEIFGMPGTYAEAISTHSGGSILNFIGVDPNLCIISGSQSGRLVWLQRGSRFCNWTVNNVGNGNGQGIGFDDFSNSVIEDVIVSSESDGIILTAGHNGRVKNAYINAIWDGLQTSNTTDCEFQNIFAFTDSTTTQAGANTLGCRAIIQANSGSTGNRYRHIRALATRNDTTAHPTAAFELNGGDAILEDAILKVAQTNAGGSGDVRGYSDSNVSTSRLTMTRTFFSTANAGSGGRFDIRNNAGAVIDVLGNYYSTVSGNAPITTASLDSDQVADAVLDALTADHNGAGSIGAAIGAAGTAGDPWITNLPGAYGAGTAGNIVGNIKKSSRIPS